MTLSRTTAERIPEPIRDALWPFYGCALTCGNGRIPVTLLHGTTRSGAQGSMLLADADRQANYFARRFFRETPRREILAETTVWKLEAEMAKWREHSDVTIAVVDRLSAGLFFRDQYLTLPLWVRARMTIPAENPGAVKLSASLASDLRRLRRETYESKVSTKNSDFDLFYSQFYTPYVSSRHADAAIVQSPDLLYSYFREGAILWLLRKGERVAACLFAIYDRVLFALEEGVLNGEMSLAKAGVISSLELHVFDYACRQNCAALDKGGCRPSLQDGVLRFKRKWGITLSEKHRRRPDFLVRWDRWTPAVAGFLAGTSLIFRRDDQLSAVAALPSGDPGTQTAADRLHHLLWTDGLQRLMLVNASGWQPDIAPPPKTALIAAPVSVADLLRA